MAKIPFTLEAWLADKSHIVETRDGRPARIICTDAKADDGACVIALIPGYGGEEAYQFFPNGHAFSSKSSDEDCADLFLITPEPELSEFEEATLKAFDKMCAGEKHLTPRTNHIKEAAEELLALARKEIEKDFPRWKKCGEDTGQTIFYKGFCKGQSYLEMDGYRIMLSDLEKLPKEDEK